MNVWTREELEKLAPDQIASIADAVANRVTKWRTTFASWQLGTRLPDDPELQAVKHQREAQILLRAEVNALTALMIEAGITTSLAFTQQLILELQHLDKGYEKLFPGFSSTEDGMAMKLPEAAVTMAGWRP